MDALVVWDVVDDVELDALDNVELGALDNVELERGVAYDVELVDGVYYEVYYGHHGLVSRF